ncbi:MAG: heavy metal translocating P-type ATPase [Gammaproteobacteria bacterium]
MHDRPHDTRSRTATGTRQAPEADYDDPLFQEGVVTTLEDGAREVTLIVDGMVCPACAMRSEERLRALPGVAEAEVSYATRRARLRWDGARARLSDLLRGLREAGYDAEPYTPSGYVAAVERERKRLLRQFGVAMALGMQVMMIAIAVYVGEASGMEPEYRALFRWLMLVMSAPVCVYSAAAFFVPAWRDLRHRRLGMDVPVALAIAIAFLASVVATITGRGPVYFDSAVMFVALLLGGRLMELGARRRAAQVAENLVRQAPSMATRVIAGTADGERIAAARLRAGDTILVRAGEQVPADAVVIQGSSGVDEALITGESRPVMKTPGAALVAGSINIDAALTARVARSGPGTVLAQIGRLLERAQAGRPRLTRLADAATGRFVAAVLVLAAAVAMHGLMDGRPDWLPVVVSVLVVACPCALSLAAPAALTASTGAMLRRGLLVIRADAIESLAHVDHVVFDKTGTLTTGQLALAGIEPLAGLGRDDCLARAAALEQASIHPIAAAIRRAAGGSAPAAVEVSLVPGQGVNGRIDGVRYWLGSAAFVAAAGHAPARNDGALERAVGETVIYLADESGPLARLRLRDELRPGAQALVAALRARGVQVSLCSGDDPVTARCIGAAVGVDDVHAGLLPDAKLEYLRGLQRAGARVAMVGDGINDAPVLAAADVAVAVDSGADVARAQADIVVFGRRLAQLQEGIRIAGDTLGIVRQNVAWAVGYNLVALPVAAAGYMAPWIAAIGMSLSSVLVVANALRLLRA